MYFLSLLQHSHEKSVAASMFLTWVLLTVSQPNLLEMAAKASGTFIKLMADTCAASQVLISAQIKTAETWSRTQVLVLKLQLSQQCF